MVNIETYEKDEDATIKGIWETDGKIEAKTELDTEQVKVIALLDTMGLVTGSGVIDYHINNYMIKQLSHKRQSRNEFVSSIKAKREDFVNKGKGFFNGLMG